MKAFLFDLNGTMIDDMQYHINAWYRILNDLGANISIERVKQECYGKNHELLERIFPGKFSEQEKDKLSIGKETEYQKQFKPFLRLIPGLHEFLNEAYKKQIPMAIGSAAIMPNIDFVLDNMQIRHYFRVLVSADNVHRSKPDPETYLQCAEQLSVHPSDCIVFEDTPKGVESAFNAGMKCIVITTIHAAHEFDSFPNVLACIEDYTTIKPADLLSPTASLQ